MQRTIRGFMGFLVALNLTGCGYDYCYKYLDPETKDPEKIKQFLDDNIDCKPPGVMSLMVRKGNRLGVDHLRGYGVEIKKKSVPFVIENGWFDLIPEDVNWDYPGGLRPYSHLCGISDSVTFLRYFSNVGNGGLLDERGNSCMHYRVLGIDDVNDEKLSDWKAGVDLIVEKGGGVNSINKSGETPLDVLKSECYAKTNIDDRCEIAEQIIRDKIIEGAH